MKRYINPATVAVELQGERIMQNVEQSAYHGEAGAPGRSDGSSFDPL